MMILKVSLCHSRCELILVSSMGMPPLYVRWDIGLGGGGMSRLVYRDRDWDGAERVRNEKSIVTVGSRAYLKATSLYMGSQ